MSPLWLITGGVRSGKSRLATRLASHATAETDELVTYIATAEPGDAEMAARIRAHRAARPGQWRTVEQPHALADAIAGAQPGCVVVDCLTLWLSNRLLARWPEAEAGGPPPPEIEATIAAEVGEVLSAVAGRDGPIIIVSNEVGSGIIPATPLTRAYSEALGPATARLAAIAERVYLCLAGQALELKALGARSVDEIG